MKNLYLPKETVIKGLVALILGIVTILKMFGIDLGVTESDISTAVLSLVDVVAFAYLIYKNFVTSKSNHAATNKMRWAKQMAKVGDLTVYDELRGEDDDC